MHALLISALSLPPRHISDGLPPRQLSEGLVFLAIMLPLLCCVLLPLFLVWIGVIEHSNPKIQFGYVAKESRKPSIFQGVWHRKETFIQPGLEETTLQRTESQRM